MSVPSRTREVFRAKLASAWADWDLAYGVQLAALARGTDARPAEAQADAAASRHGHWARAAVLAEEAVEEDRKRIVAAAQAAVVRALEEAPLSPHFRRSMTATISASIEEATQWHS